MKFNQAALLPLVMKLGELLKVGFDHYVALRAAGVEVTVEIITGFLCVKLADWDPVVGGRHLLDEPTRQAAARFLAGVASNLAK